MLSNFLFDTCEGCPARAGHQDSLSRDESDQWRAYRVRYPPPHLLAVLGNFGTRLPLAGGPAGGATENVYGLLVSPMFLW